MKTSIQSLRSLSLVGATVGLLAACGSVSSVSSVDSNYSDYELYRSAAADGIVYVGVTGSAGSLSEEQLNAIVADQFEIAHIGPEASFSTDPTNIDNGKTRFVVSFNPGPSVNVGNICSIETSEIGSAENGSPMRAIGAFCRGTSARTWTISTVRDTSQKVEVAEFAKSVAHEIIPRPSRQPACESDLC